MFVRFQRKLFVFLNQFLNVERHQTVSKCSHVAERSLHFVQCHFYTVVICAFLVIRKLFYVIDYKMVQKLEKQQLLLSSHFQTNDAHLQGKTHACFEISEGMFIEIILKERSQV
uniref:Uncharacterized protein n=1 Tax=Cacopsylla melanoneura TaxID=428564 RepID=A0A8D8WPQ0_9HEMI